MDNAVPRRPARGAMKPKTAAASADAFVAADAAKAAAKPGKKGVKKKSGKPPTKKEAHREKWSPANVGRSASSALQAAIKMAALESGDETLCVAGKAGQLVIGIPLPAFCLECLLQNNVLRLGITIQLAGVPGTCKSGLAFEIARWFGLSGGVANLIENEGKYSDRWALSILDSPTKEIMSYEEGTSLQNAMDRLTFWTKHWKKYMTGTKENPGSGPVFPVLLLLDSLMGKPSEEVMTQIDTDGHSSRNYAIEANLLKSYMSTLQTAIQGWPFIWLYTNHLKLSKDKQGFKERNKSGGQAKEFLETIEIEMTKAQHASGVNTVDHKGLALQLEVRKNSVGDTGGKLSVEILWWKKFDEATGEVVQVTKWQWHAATIKMLSGIAPGSVVGKALKDVVDINKMSGDKWWSKVLGVRKEKPISAQELGEILQGREDLLQRLRPLFGIVTRKVFETGVDYKEQRRRQREAIHGVTEAQ